MKQPWWHVTKTESQAFWIGGLYAATALFGWVGVAMEDSKLLTVVMVVWFTLMAAAYLTSGLARRRLSAVNEATISGESGRPASR